MGKWAYSSRKQKSGSVVSVHPAVNENLVPDNPSDHMKHADGHEVWAYYEVKGYDGIVYKRTSDRIRNFLFERYSHIILGVAMTPDGIYEFWPHLVYSMSDTDGARELIKAFNEYGIRSKYEAIYTFNRFPMLDPLELYYEPETAPELPPNRMIIERTRVFKEYPSDQYEGIDFHFNSKYSDIVVKGLEKTDTGFWMENYGVTLATIDPKELHRNYKEVFRLIHELHKRGWYHGDVKLDNILSNGKKYKLIDLENAVHGIEDMILVSNTYAPMKS